MTSVSSEFRYALGELYGGRSYTFSAVGDRCSECWTRDVQAIMNGDVDTLAVLSDGRREIIHGKGSDFHLPFTTFSDSAMKLSLNSASRHEVRNILVVLAAGDVKITQRVDVVEHKEHFLQCADIILSEFGEDVAYRTNMENIPEPRDIDDFRVQEWYSFTDHLLDLGVIAVSDAKVGLFWSFVDM